MLLSGLAQLKRRGFPSHNRYHCSRAANYVSDGVQRKSVAPPPPQSVPLGYWCGQGIRGGEPASSGQPGTLCRSTLALAHGRCLALSSRGIRRNVSLFPPDEHHKRCSSSSRGDALPECQVNSHVGCRPALRPQFLCGLRSLLDTAAPGQPRFGCLCTQNQVALCLLELCGSYQPRAHTAA